MKNRYWTQFILHTHVYVVTFAALFNRPTEEEFIAFAVLGFFHVSAANPSGLYIHCSDVGICAFWQFST
ncbi:hypothetical protein MRB53_026940 [Persea americana]|uniref:Uncharacterized protein n=1 Tax=Persea americana TaxID=3435 RepID=A0ACC2LJN9_PERAE|nr:hypothetical protein MRB53_026940 [Persea americana]